LEITRECARIGLETPGLYARAPPSRCVRRGPSFFETAKVKVNGYIDGLSYFHAMIRIGKEQCRLCDPGKIVQVALKPTEKINRIAHFTSMPRHRSGLESAERVKHIKDLEALGYDVILGEMKQTVQQVSLPIPGLGWLGVRGQHKIIQHKEKQTDINIAMEMTKDALLGKCDKMVLVSSDSDFVPVVRFVLDQGIRVTILVPPGQKMKEMRQLAREYPGKLVVRQLAAEEAISFVLEDARSKPER